MLFTCRNTYIYPTVASTPRIFLDSQSAYFTRLGGRASSTLSEILHYHEYFSTQLLAVNLVHQVVLHNHQSASISPQSRDIDTFEEII